VDTPAGKDAIAGIVRWDLRDGYGSEYSVDDDGGGNSRWLREAG
jgi:hypothetical protein